MAKYRTFTPEFKSQIVLQVLTGTKSAASASIHRFIAPPFPECGSRLPAGAA